jgi:K+-transporting ATPase KdpF subunit
MIKIILIALAVALVAVLIYAATRPDAFRVERSAVIQAPPEKVFALINDFRRWTAWSPWEKVDPELKRTHSGAASGKGAAYAWEGNKNVGSGRMEITESAAPAKILIKLDFIKPFEGHNTAEFTLTPGPQGTTVTWAMFGPSPYISKLMGVFINMDRMIGGQFELGLATMKTVAETGKETP